MKKNVQQTATGADTQWFVNDRFGMFIHWGLYAMGARHEWVQHEEKIPVGEYEAKYFKRFNPDLYDPTLWAKAASNAGMKYFVVTTKHHEGFALWDSRLTDYKAPNTPIGRDLLRPMVDAFRQEDMHVGLYHSLIDWHHPHNTIDKFMGPYREAKDMASMNRKRRQTLYAQYLRGQVRELLSDYGKIDILWLDFSYPHRDKKGKALGKGREHWESEKLYEMVRELQPGIILNDRLDLEYGWDIKTPEQYQPREWVTVNGKRVMWEACQTFSGSWGYHRDESSWKSVDMLVRLLIDTVSKGGNLLLNVGPTSRGQFDERALESLQGIGEWMSRHSRSIYGCTEAPAGFKTPQDCRLTYNPETKRLYVHVFAWPCFALFLDGYAKKVKYAQLLNDGSELRMREWKPHDKHVPANRFKDSLMLSLPVRKPDVAVPVIELFLE